MWAICSRCEVFQEMLNMHNLDLRKKSQKKSELCMLSHNYAVQFNYGSLCLSSHFCTFCLILSVNSLSSI